jgi:hypothetical protein
MINLLNDLTPLSTAIIHLPIRLAFLSVRVTCLPSHFVHLSNRMTHLPARLPHLPTDLACLPDHLFYLSSGMMR